MPKYAALIYGDAADESRQPTPEEMQTIMEEYTEFGRNNDSAIAGGEALHPTATATTVHFEGGRGGRLVVTDGPFAESKEVLGGFYLIEADDLDAALEVAQQIPGAWHGKVEVRPVMEFDDSGQPVD